MRFMLLLAALGLWSCSGWCAGCSDGGSGTTRFADDAGACFIRMQQCRFPALPHPPEVSVVSVPCDGGL